jgi:vancomycin permeability regulator SanA
MKLNDICRGGYSKKSVLCVAIVVLVLFILVISPQLYYRLEAGGKITTASNYSGPDIPVGIVFGAGVDSSGQPYPQLQARLDKALEFYNMGKIRKILVSGDNRFKYYDEPSAMKKYLIDNGLPKADIIQDFAGRSTYETCYRAKKIFGLNQAVLFTQKYHLYRAIDACDKIGLESYGIISDGQWEKYDSLISGYTRREYLASWKSFYMTRISKPDAEVMGDTIKIEL